MSDFKWKRFQGEIILDCVRLYCKYGISHRDLEGRTLSMIAPHANEKGCSILAAIKPVNWMYKTVQETV